MVHRTRRSQRHPARFAIRPLVAALVACGAIASAHGATINVITGGDAGDGSSCTVRQAVTSLNGGAVVDGCGVASGSFGSNDTVNLALQAGTITLTQGPLVPTVSMTFAGPGANALTISGGGASRVIENPGGNVQVDGLLISGGNSVGPGGCIFVEDLVLTNSVVSGCRSTNDTNLPYLNAMGGGVAAKYILSYRSAIVSNRADTAAGGAIAFEGGVFVQTLVSGNTVNTSSCPTFDYYCAPALFGGGGIVGGTVLTQASTISGNTVNALIMGKYDSGQTDYYNIGFGGGISQIPFEEFGPAFGPTALKTSAKRPGALLFGSRATTPGRAQAAVKARVAQLRAAGGPRVKVDGQGIGIVGLSHSTVSGNRVTGNRENPGKYAGGGVFAVNGYYNAEFANSTISGNRLEAGQGGYGIGAAFAGGPVDMSNSTISGNVGEFAVAIKYGTSPLLPTAKAGVKPGGKALATLRAKAATLAGSRTKAAVNKALTQPVFNSTIIANADAIDVSCGGGNPCTIGGAKNLIRTVDVGVTVPPGTLTSDPRLAPLGNYGGVLAGAPNRPLTAPTPTQPLLFGSPAVDAGNNLEGFEFDQRGPGFPRVLGAAADIGAVEGALAANQPVPALGPWLLALLSAMLGAIGLSRRRRT